MPCSLSPSNHTFMLPMFYIYVNAKSRKQGLGKKKRNFFLSKVPARWHYIHNSCPLECAVGSFLSHPTLINWMGPIELGWHTYKTKEKGKDSALAAFFARWTCCPFENERLGDSWVDCWLCMMTARHTGSGMDRRGFSGIWVLVMVMTPLSPPSFRHTVCYSTAQKGKQSRASFSCFGRLKMLMTESIDVMVRGPSPDC